MVTLNRRQLLAALAASPLALRSLRAARKTMRGAFIIAATPYKDEAGKPIDFDDLAGEVDYLHTCGVQGMVWPQMASEFAFLTEDERMQGMETLAKAAKGKSPALVLGVQAPNKQQMLAYARHAQKLRPDAVIAMPPSEAESLDEYRDYYAALCKAVDLPVFIQTTGGAKNLLPSVEMIVELAREYPNFGYVKEEAKPVIERLTALAEHRPNPIKSVFSGAAGKGWTYEMRLGFDGTMPGAMFADVYALLWELHLKGDHDKMREVFSKLLLMVNLDQQIPGVRNYVFRKRGIFKTAVSRRADYSWNEAQRAEIDWNLDGLSPYFRF